MLEMLKESTWFEKVFAGFLALLVLGMIVLVILAAVGVIQFTHDPNYHSSPIMICNKIGSTMQVCTTV